MADHFESTAERLIREAMEAGELDDPPGAGKPLPGAGTHDDELWWVHSWMKRNGVILSLAPDTFDSAEDGRRGER